MSDRHEHVRIPLTRRPEPVLTPDERLALTGALAALELVGEDELADLSTAALGWFEDWLVGRFNEAPGPDEQVAALVKVIADLRTRLAWIEVGADFATVTPGVPLDSSQLWASLLNDRPDARLGWLRSMSEQGHRGMSCFLNNHEDRLAQLSARCRQLEDQVRGLGGDPNA